MAQPLPLNDVTGPAGAVFTEDQGWRLPDHFGDPAREYQAAVDRAAVFDWSARGKVELAGTEALPFFHNLCTNDINNLAPGAGCEAFLTTIKARLIAPLYVSRLRRDGGKVLLLDTAPGLGEKICQHLGKYRISEDVDITDHTGALALLHLCGPDAPSLAAQAVGVSSLELSPLQHLEQTQDSSIIVVRRNDVLNLPGFDLFIPVDKAGQFWCALVQAEAAPAGLQAWEMLRVEAGLPRFGVDMDEDRLVMEIGRTAQAVSFTKGCFLGQESIVMARDRGHVNRQLLGLRLSQGRPVPAGSKVLHENEELGQVTSSAQSPRLGALALAYLKRGSQTPGTTVEIDTGQDRRPAVVSELPFA